MSEYLQTCPQCSQVYDHTAYSKPFIYCPKCGAPFEGNPHQDKDARSVGGVSREVVVSAYAQSLLEGVSEEEKAAIQSLIEQDKSEGGDEKSPDSAAAESPDQLDEASTAEPLQTSYEHPIPLPMADPCIECEDMRNSVGCVGPSCGGPNRCGLYQAYQNEKRQEVETAHNAPHDAVRAHDPGSGKHVLSQIENAGKDQPDRLRETLEVGERYKALRAVTRLRDIFYTEDGGLPDEVDLGEIQRLVCDAQPIFDKEEAVEKAKAAARSWGEMNRETPRISECGKVPDSFYRIPENHHTRKILDGAAKFKEAQTKPHVGSTHPVTTEMFDHFLTATLSMQRWLSLYDWRLAFLHEMADPENAVSCVWRTNGAKTATLELSTETSYPLTKEKAQQLAFHAIMHVFFAGLVNAAVHEDLLPLQREAAVLREVQTLIRKLEHLLMPSFAEDAPTYDLLTTK